jgi:hypothetical protein
VRVHQPTALAFWKAQFALRSGPVSFCQHSTSDLPDFPVGILQAGTKDRKTWANSPCWSAQSLPAAKRETSLKLQQCSSRAALSSATAGSDQTHCSRHMQPSSR